MIDGQHNYATVFTEFEMCLYRAAAHVTVLLIVFIVFDKRLIISSKESHFHENILR